MKTFLKFEFTPTEWATLQKDIQQTTTTPSGYLPFVGDASKGVYIWGAQLNIGSTAKPYFPTTDRLNVPRLTYQNGGGGCPSLLLEKQSTNLFQYSEQFDNAYWSKLGTVTPTITANATTSPDGTASADLLAGGGGAGQRVQRTMSVSLLTAYSVSIYVKANTSTTAQLNIYDGVTDRGGEITFSTGAVTTYGSGVSATSENIGNGWFRFVMNYTSFATTSINVQFGVSGSASYYIWGAQLEASSYPTSYIPTTSASATRVADACVKSSATALIGQTEGTIYWEGIIDAFPTDNSFFGVQKTASSFVIRFGSGGSSIYAQAYNGSANLFFETMSYTLGTRIKLAFGYKAGSYAFYSNGTQIATGSNATTMPTCDSIMFNSLWGNIGNGSYKSAEAILFPTRLTNAELASLTTI